MTSRPAATPLARMFLAAGVALLLLATAAAEDAWSQASLGSQRVGTSAGTFLKIGVGARPVGMGGAFVAVANDPSSIYWNPAGIAGLLRKNVTFSHSEWPADINYEYLGLIMPVEKLGGSVGVQFGALYSDINETTELQPFGTGRTFTYTDFVGGLTYARRFTDKLLIGGTLKFVHENLGVDVGGTTINTWLVDVGSIYYIGFGSLRIGVALANFGPDFNPSGKYYSPAGEEREWDSANPPTQFRWGVAWEPVETKSMMLTTALEVSQPADNQQALKAGLEWTLQRILSLRTGYDFNADQIKWSAGAGARATLGTTQGTVDYAFSDGGVLGGIHQFSLGVQF
jgi:hypothetical protein